MNRPAGWMTVVLSLSVGLAACGTGTIEGELGGAGPNGPIPGNGGDNGDNSLPPDAGAPTPTADAAPDEPAPSFNVSVLSRDDVMSIAEASVGYTYWWGHGNLGGTMTGTCTGSCPSCTHTGPDGADCSGFVGKAWMLPEAMPIVGEDLHPYSTYNFAHETEHWAAISRSDVIEGDAMVYNTDGEGHIFLYEKDDPWGSMWTYEARGCAYGVVHNIRTAGTEFGAIRRTGL